MKIKRVYRKFVVVYIVVDVVECYTQTTTCVHREHYNHLHELTLKLHRGYV